jgi:hypothetical protein
MENIQNSNNTEDDEKLNTEENIESNENIQSDNERGIAVGEISDEEREVTKANEHFTQRIPTEVYVQISKIRRSRMPSRYNPFSFPSSLVKTIKKKLNLKPLMLNGKKTQSQQTRNKKAHCQNKITRFLEEIASPINRRKNKRRIVMIFCEVSSVGN